MMAGSRLINTGNAIPHRGFCNNAGLMGLGIPFLGGHIISSVQIPLQPLFKSLPGLLNLPLKNQLGSPPLESAHHILLSGSEPGGLLLGNKTPLQSAELPFVIPYKRIQGALFQPPVTIVKRQLMTAGKPQSPGHLLLKLAGQIIHPAFQPRLLAEILHALVLVGNIRHKLLGILQRPLNGLGRNIRHLDRGRGGGSRIHPGSSVHGLL